MERIFLIDDNHDYCEQVKKTLSLRGYELEYSTEGEGGLKRALSERWGSILLDVYLNQKMDGLDILKRIVESKPHLPIIMVSGASTLQTAVEATKMGAYDFLEKPLDVDRLLITIERALEKNKLTNLTNELKRELNKKVYVVGKSAIIQRIYKEVLQVSQTNTKVLIQGDSGVGKDVVAKLIHYHSDRASEPFVTVNCAAIPHNLVEAELFGYEQGAFTGAQKANKGKIEAAGNGTLFLDEIAELPIASQAKLLQFLQSGEYRRLGETGQRKSDVRIVAATNKDLQQEIVKGVFRRDLFYRLNMVTIKIPPLRERPEDIQPLAHFFLRRGCEKFGKTITHFSDEALQLIMEKPWVGNVRQLKSAVYRMVLFCNANVIDYGTAATAIQMDRTNALLISGNSYEAALKEFEKLYFLKQLHSHQGDLERAARDSGLSLTQFKEKLDALDIPYDAKFQNAAS